MLVLQAIVNIAVVTNSVPYTGVTLPLVSFGGSSTVISLLAVGLLLNISRYTAASAPKSDQPARPAPGAVAPSTPRVRQHALPIRTRATARRQKVYG
jgi:cell division protein FtsW